MDKKQYFKANRRWLAEKAKEDGVKPLPKGIYLLSIRLKDGTMVNKKFAMNL